MLSARTETILRSIVHQYIEDAVPVPSQSVANKSELGVSTATIRNEMMRLEQDGYIIRPHPSAGSIPSDKGYRHYVESLGDLRLSATEQRLASHMFHQVEIEIDRWLNLASTLIAGLVENVAIVTKPKTPACKLKHVELVALQDSLALLIVVLYGAKVRQQLIKFETSLAQTELMAVSSKLNDTFASLNSSYISAKDAELPPAERQVMDCVINMMQAEDEEDYEEPYLDGLHFMMNQPEFSHNRETATLMEMVEHRNLLKSILPKKSGGGVEVIIGRENKDEAFRNYSVVISHYGIPGEAVGVVCVVGPTRMQYTHTIPSVNYLSSLLSQLVAGLYGKENPAAENQHGTS